MYNILKRYNVRVFCYNIWPYIGLLRPQCRSLMLEIIDVDELLHNATNSVTPIEENNNSRWYRICLYEIDNSNYSASATRATNEKNH